jgi:hypothetical protein
MGFFLLRCSFEVTIVVPFKSSSIFKNNTVLGNFEKPLSNLSNFPQGNDTIDKGQSHTQRTIEGQALLQSHL